MTQIRTSASSPLRIDVLSAPAGSGEIGMTLCPGKRGESVQGGYWQRDLAADLDVIRRWGAKVLVTAMESDEMEAFGVGQLGPAAKRVGVSWLHVPISDGQIPDHRFYDSWPKTAPVLLHHLKTGNRIVIHCRGGLGRTGLLACLLLVELGLKPANALEAVRQARPGAVETAAQERFVLSYERGSWAMLPTSK